MKAVIRKEQAPSPREWSETRGLPICLTREDLCLIPHCEETHFKASIWFHGGIHNAKDEEEAFLDWSDDDDDGFDPSTLPDPDKYRSSEESDSEDMENKISDTKKMQGMRKRNSGEVEDMRPTSSNRKKAKWETLEPLDTGLSLAEDEELVLHLLKNQS